MKSRLILGPSKRETLKICNERTMTTNLYVSFGLPQHIICGLFVLSRNSKIICLRSEDRTETAYCGSPFKFQLRKVMLVSTVSTHTLTHSAPFVLKFALGNPSYIIQYNRNNCRPKPHHSIPLHYAANAKVFFLHLPCLPQLLTLSSSRLPLWIMNMQNA